MEQFITNVSSFPTVVFSVMLIIATVFWVFAILGAVDIDVFDADLDFDFDMDVDSEVDAHGVTGLAGFLMYFGLHGIPITVVLSFLISLSWLFCYFGSAYLLPILPGTFLKFLGGIILIFVCFFVSLPIASISLKPTKHLFTSPGAARKDSFTGSSCVITTLEVNREFGQAEMSLEGTTVLLDVRADPEYKLTKGNVAAIISYDKTTEVYEVIPEEEFMKL